MPSLSVHCPWTRGFGKKQEVKSNQKSSGWLNCGTEIRFDLLVAGNFCQCWNLNSSVSHAFEILIVVLKQNFKTNWMSKPDFLRRDPILYKFWILSCGKKTWSIINNYAKLGCPYENLVWSFNFFWNFALLTIIRMSKACEIWEFKFRYWQKSQSNKTSQNETLCGRLLEGTQGTIIYEIVLIFDPTSTSNPCCCCYWERWPTNVRTNEHGKA